MVLPIPGCPRYGGSWNAEITPLLRLLSPATTNASSFHQVLCSWCNWYVLAHLLIVSSFSRLLILIFERVSTSSMGSLPARLTNTSAGSTVTLSLSCLRERASARAFLFPATCLSMKLYSCSSWNSRAIRRLIFSRLLPVQEVCVVGVVDYLMWG